MVSRRKRSLLLPDGIRPLIGVGMGKTLLPSYPGRQFRDLFPVADRTRGGGTVRGSYLGPTLSTRLYKPLTSVLSSLLTESG